MRHVMDCRRTFIAVFGISLLAVMGIVGDADVAGSIATIALGVAASNAAQKVMQKENHPVGPMRGE